MPGFDSVVFGLIIIACYSAASPSEPQPLELSVQRLSSKQSASSVYSRIHPEIEELPWIVFAHSGKQVCSGMIIHKDWILALNSCSFNGTNGSDVVVLAGGDTPQTATQVSKAKVHHTTDLFEGVTLLHLNESLAFNKKVQPARIPWRPIGNINYFNGHAYGFAYEGDTFQLTAYDTTVFTDLCSDSENLCALGLDWPQPDVTLAGIDFLEIPDYIDDKGTFYTCVIGGRKSQLANNFTSYYPLLNILPSIEKELGLTVQPTPPAAYPDEQALCGIFQ